MPQERREILKEVALVIADALEARRPRFRYPVGPFARLNHFLRGKLPSRPLRRATTFYLGLSRGGRKRGESDPLSNG